MGMLHYNIITWEGLDFGDARAQQFMSLIDVTQGVFTAWQVQHTTKYYSIRSLESH